MLGGGGISGPRVRGLRLPPISRVHKMEVQPAARWNRSEPWRGTGLGLPAKLVSGRRRYPGRILLSAQRKAHAGPRGHSTERFDGPPPREGAWRELPPYKPTKRGGESPAPSPGRDRASPHARIFSSIDFRAALPPAPRRGGRYPPPKSSKVAEGEPGPGGTPCGQRLHAPLGPSCGGTNAAGRGAWHRQAKG